MKRRDFVKITGAAAATPLLLNGLSVSANGSPVLKEITNEDNDKILVLIFLNGGNDGLNTVLPLDKYSTLSQARQNLLIPENTALKLRDDLGLHPILTGLKEMWDDEKLGVIQNVAYPNQNFSHFRSTDIWNSASDADKFETSGWLGRWLADKHPNYPEEYPNTNSPDPLSLTIGSLVSQTCQGPVYNMGLAMNSTNLYELQAGRSDTPPDGYVGQELEFVRTVIDQTMQYTDTLQSAVDNGRTSSQKWPETGVNRLADQMKLITQLISGGLKTKVYVCQITGFDTHANQIETEGETTTGFHAQLISNVSEAIRAFQDEIKIMGMEDKVLGMTFSEFGRRIISNDSMGTDHGSAAPMFVWGSKVNPMIHGTNPEIPSGATAQDNLEMEFDFRSVYWSILKDWFEVDDSKLTEILFKEFPYIPIIEGVSSASEVRNSGHDLRVLGNYPNPVISTSNLNFYTIASPLRITMIDNSGREIVLLEKQFSTGEHSIPLDLSSFRNGNYFIRLENNKSKVIHKVMVAK